MLKKKKEYAKEHLATNIDKMACPKCGAGFSLEETGSLICTNHHTFNLSKKGIIHFPDHHMTSDYDTDMLTHRRKMIQKGLYAPVLESITKELSHLRETDLLVDMGSGEGSFVELLDREYHVPSQKMGFDLSKDGVLLSSDFSKEAFWFIADVTNMPFADHAVSALLNIFSPSHYEEMKRVLADDGLIIKVIPEENYLKELRQAFYAEKEDKQTYSNDKVYDKFVKELELIKETRVTYQFPVLQEDYESILKMSPIHWGASKEALAQAKDSYFEGLTIDVLILVGKKK